MAPPSPEKSPKSLPLDFGYVIRSRVSKQRSKCKAAPLLGHIVLSLIVTVLNFLPDQLVVISILPITST